MISDKLGIEIKSFIQQYQRLDRNFSILYSDDVVTNVRSVIKILKILNGMSSGKTEEANEEVKLEAEAVLKSLCKGKDDLEDDWRSFNTLLGMYDSNPILIKESIKLQITKIYLANQNYDALLNAVVSQLPQFMGRPYGRMVLDAHHKPDPISDQEEEKDEA